MKINTPEISWHAKEAIYSVDIQAKQKDQPLRVATAGIDSNVRIWEIKSGCKTGVTFLSNLSRHEKAVNVVRFSRTGKILASGGDDGNIVLWKLSDKGEAPNIFEDDSEIGKNLESWNASKVLRGHLEDINDLCWSHDENFLISGSIDHTAILWDITKGSKICIMSDAKHFIHGVTFDPLGQYAAVMSADRSLRIYNIQTKRVLHNVTKMVYPDFEESIDDMQVDGEDVPASRSQRLFHDESVVRRRLDFTCDGNFLIVPSGCLTKRQGDQPEQINTAYIFTRGCLSKPAAILPGFKQPVTVIRCCPAKFQLRKNVTSAINLPYRIIFAVASIDTVLLYDTQCLEPIALVGNIHYAALTDVAWSDDGHQLIVSSRDGFCTIVQFDEDELGLVYTEEIPLSQEETTASICNREKDSADAKDSETIIPSQNNDNESQVNDEPVAVVHEIDATCNGVTDSESVKDNAIQNDGSKDGEIDNGEAVIDTTNQESTGSSSTSSQEKKPRRVQLTPVSCSTGIKTPRRVELTTISRHETVTCKGKYTPSSESRQKDTNPAEYRTTPKSMTEVTKGNQTQLMAKRTPRRIQLTPVND